MTQQFVALFPYRLDSVVKQPGSTQWRRVSQYYYLSDEDIIESIKNKAKLVRGYCFDDRTQFLILHIPSSSQYHNLESIQQIRSTLSKASINIKHYQGQNEDWYLYVFFTEPVNSLEYAVNLSAWLQQKGFLIGQDMIEVHPTKTALPFPLQENFIWLNEQCQLVIRRDEMSLEEALRLFLSDIEKSAITPEAFIAAMQIGQLSEEQRTPESSAEQQIQAIDEQIEDLSRQPGQEISIDNTDQLSEVSEPISKKKKQLKKVNREKNIQLSLPLFGVGESVKREGLSDPVGFEVSRAPPEFIRNYV